MSDQPTWPVSPEAAYARRRALLTELVDEDHGAVAAAPAPLCRAVFSLLQKRCARSAAARGRRR
jgi:hypothetical protein